MKFTLLILLMTISLTVYSQSNKKFSDYYHHKKAHFDNLPNTDDEIIFLGNSITDGGEWSEMFHDLRVKNRGISGDITEGILFRLKEVTESKPLKVFIMIGVNDLSKNISITQILYNYENIIKSIKSASPETKIYVQSVLPVNPDFPGNKKHTNKTQKIIDLNSDLVKLAQIHRVEFIDLFSVFKNESNQMNKKYTQDGLHLNAEGYKLWKTTIEYLIK